jgi:FMN reductase
MAQYSCATLRGIVHAMRGWPTPFGITVNTVEQKVFGEDGKIIDTHVKNSCALQAEQILEFARSITQAA